MRNIQTLLYRSLLLGALLLLYGVPAIHAATRYVTPSGSDASDGLSWATAKATIQAAVNDAISGEEVWVAAGTYIGRTDPKNGTLIYGGFNSTETDRSQRDYVHNVTILDGNNASWIFYIAPNMVCTIDGFTLRNGYQSTENGGAIFSSNNASPIIANNIFANNHANYDGGALFLGSGGSPVVTNNTFTENVARNGGAIFYYSPGNSSPTISNNTFINNTSTQDGGAVFLQFYLYGYSSGGATPVITGNTFQGNTSATHGGGLYVYSRSNNSGNPNTITVTNNTFIGNNTTNTGYHGGGAYLYGINPGYYSSLTFTGNTVRGNSASGIGGGLYIYAFNTATVANNTILSNSAAGSGGGVYFDGTSGPVTFKNNLVAKNTTAAEGGGVYWNTTPGIIANNTIADNTAPTSSGGLTMDNASPAVANNIVAFNTVGIKNIGSGSPTLGTNDVYGNATSNYSGLSAGSTDFSLDPLFYDRPGNDYHIASTSPVIDSGDNSFVLGGDTDLDNNPRIYDVNVDLGAYEFAPLYAELSTLVVTPSTLGSLTSGTGVVTLAGNAPPGGAVVKLFSENPSFLTVPLNVVIPGGSPSVAFTVTAKSTIIPRTAYVRAVYRGNVLRFAVTVRPLLNTLTVNPAAVIGGGSTAGTITLASPAPSGGVIVNLVSMDASVTVPATVSIGAGSSQVSFSVTTSSVTALKSVVINATYGAESVSSTLYLNPTATLKSIVASPLTGVGGWTTVYGYVTLTGKAPAGGIAVALSSSNPGAADVPAVAIVPAGRSKATVLITTRPVTSTATVTLTARLGAVTKTGTLSVTPVVVSTVTLLSATVVRGDDSIAVITLNAPAPAGGVIVNLSSSAPGVALPTVPTLYIPAGQTTGVIYVDTYAAGTANIIAALNGGSKNAKLTVTL